MPQRRKWQPTPVLSSHPQHAGGLEHWPGPALSTQGAQEPGTQLWPDPLQSWGTLPKVRGSSTLSPAAGLKRSQSKVRAFNRGGTWGFSPEARRGSQGASRVQFSHPYMTTGKTIALTRRTFVGKVMSLLLNMLSRLVRTFLPRNKRLFNFMAAITICSDFGAPQNKV